VYAVGLLEDVFGGFDVADVFCEFAGLGKGCWVRGCWEELGC
jgi:hypothetical protein